MSRHEPVRFAHDEHARAAFHRRQRGPALEQTHRRHRMTGHAVRRGIERLLPPLLHDPRQRLRRLVYLLVRIPGLGPRDRREPVHVRVTEPGNQPAGPALPTGLELPPLAQRQLGQPECKSLLSHADRAGEEQHLGQPAGAGGLGQPLAGFLVSDQVRQ